MLTSVAVHLFGDIYRVVDGALAIDDRIVAVHAIAQHNGIYAPELLHLCPFAPANTRSRPAEIRTSELLNTIKAPATHEENDK